ncbi:MAG: hypothetical protein KGQ46_13975 [Hyphomicrobiales bacterium]|nr:hypothetical protein [Hyphomicrobiales bacterium]MDE2115813.1 hypothetical protein [Hyphomicrobiales bacterium]
MTVVVAGLAVAAPTSPAFAQDAPWGCQVLLCAAATSPSWSGIPYCVPPMEALFSQLARGGGWPSCPEGGETSGLGYQPYKPCPAPDINVDYQPATFGSQSEQITTGVFQADPNGAYCSPPEQISNFTLRQQQNTTYGQDTSGPPPLDFTPQLTLATANATPYYVDITPSGATSIRFYFSLQGY